MAAIADPDQQEYQDYLDYQKYTASPAYKSNSASAPQSATSSPLAAGLQGFGQAGTLGYLPEAQAAIGSLVPNPTKDIDEYLKYQGFNLNQDDKSGLNLAEARTRNQSLKKSNPYAYGAGNIAGSVATAPIYGGLLSKIPGMGGGINAATWGNGAVQGAIAGAKGGAALGMLQNPAQGPNDSSFDVGGRVSGAAGGAVIGGALGGAVGGLIGKYGKAPTQTIENKNIPITETNTPTQEPVNVSDLSKQVSKFKETGGSTELPTAKMLQDVVARNPDIPKPIPGFHDKMLSSKADYEELRTLAESPTDSGKNIRAYEQMMKSSAEDKLGKSIKDVAGRDPIDKMESGEQLMGSILDKYNQTKDQLGPVFEQFKNMNLPKQKIVPEIREQITADIPKLSKYLKVNDETGSLDFAPFTPKMGITPQAHSVLSQTVDALNSKQLSFEDIQNIREFMRQSIDPANPKATLVLGQARKSLLNYMDTLVGQKAESISASRGQNPNNFKAPDVRGVFSQYAGNEKNIDQVERIIGGKLENFDQLLMARPERVLDRVFSSPTNIKVMREVIGDDGIKKLSGDYMNNLIERSTNKGILSSQKLSTLMSQKGYSLNEAMGPDKFQRIKDLTDYMRLVPDTPSANPSGTARSAEILKKIVMLQPREAAKQGIEALKDIGTNRAASQQLQGLMQPPSAVKGNIFNMKTLPGKIGGLLNKELLK